MWNSKKYLAMAVVGAGLAVAAASPASAQFFGGFPGIGMNGGFPGGGLGGGLGGLGGWGGGWFPPTTTNWQYPPYYPQYQQPQIIVLRVGGGGYAPTYGCAPRASYGCGCGMARAYVPVRPSFGCGRVAIWHHAYPTVAAYRHSYAVAFHHPARVNAVYAARSHHGHLYASYGVKRHYAKHGYSLKFA